MELLVIILSSVSDLYYQQWSEQTYIHWVSLQSMQCLSCVIWCSVVHQYNVLKGMCASKQNITLISILSYTALYRLSTYPHHPSNPPSILFIYIQCSPMLPHEIPPISTHPLRFPPIQSTHSYPSFPISSHSLWPILNYHRVPSYMNSYLASHVWLITYLSCQILSYIQIGCPRLYPITQPLCSHLPPFFSSYLPSLV
jgi:hypothetical protein